MSKVIVLSGPSGCGKSYYAAVLADADNDFNTRVISSDKVREFLFGNESTQGDPAEVFKTVDAYVEGHLSLSHTVIVDATNLTARNRESYVTAALRYEVPCELHVFVASYEQCMKGQEGRERKVPAFVVARHCEQALEDQRTVDQRLALYTPRPLYDTVFILGAHPTLHEHVVIEYQNGAEQTVSLKNLTLLSPPEKTHE